MDKIGSGIKKEEVKESVKVVTAVEEDKPKVVVEEKVDAGEEAQKRAEWEAFLNRR
jgi:prophage tail gpP-like protein